MSDRLPSSIPVLVIGAGVHGLSTAWHVAKRGDQVLVCTITARATSRSARRLRRAT